MRGIFQPIPGPSKYRARMMRAGRFSLEILRYVYHIDHFSRAARAAIGKIALKSSREKRPGGQWGG